MSKSKTDPFSDSIECPTCGHDYDFGRPGAKVESPQEESFEYDKKVMEYNRGKGYKEEK